MLRRVLLASGFLHVFTGHLPGLRRRGRSLSLYALLEQEKSFSIWKGLVDAAGMQPLLQGTRPLTMFVPDDGALDGLDSVRLDRLAGETAAQCRERFAHLVRTHIIEGRHDPQDIERSGAQYPTLGPGTMSFYSNDTNNLTVYWTSSTVTVGAPVTAAPLQASNGLLYPLWKIFIA